MLDSVFMRRCAETIGEPFCLAGSLTAGYAVDWTARFKAATELVLRPGNTEEVAEVLKLCSEYGVQVVPQGGNTGLVGGGVPLDGEAVLSLTRLDTLSDFSPSSLQVTAGAGVTLSALAHVRPDLDFGVSIAGRDTATVGGAVATNAGGIRVLRYGAMRDQVKGLEAVLSDGTIISHLGGLVKDNTGYDYLSLLTGSEGTLAVITKARLQLVPRLPELCTVLIGFDSLEALHLAAMTFKNTVKGIVAAEFMTLKGIDLLTEYASLRQPFEPKSLYYLLLEAEAGSLEELGELIGDRPCAVALDEDSRARLWAYRERHPEAAGFLGVPFKLDVSVPAGNWVVLASTVESAVKNIDPQAEVIIFGHVADGNVHVNIIPSLPADGRHQDAVFNLVASLGGSISAEHGIGRLKAPWLHLSRTPSELELFKSIRLAFDPHGVLNPNVLPK